MKSSMIICPMCGHTFDPMQHSGCANCVLQRNCTLVCCPNCGFETVNPAESRLASFAEHIFGMLKKPVKTKET